mmetsp:Transcript_31808/g.38465  ORF Transcript_31808/g.38465 Transcript_31808/m.38465 type:complete len:226 (-) Transcript_31808:270-947(-)|eukprot:CAMPEP_0197846870 /NCGR_PEP_ID=MMETSP1438-20131217/4688_1 /TAXON_ID=1461541 /ORGANISM="Pterosperma sp., Strain CCMP1384" /LENGTH=225 /DNA_ID=CAMNT_0043458649 /DNA_START=81 /DNA_END=758 /DNA_ORIENTATION=-
MKTATFFLALALVAAPLLVSAAEDESAKKPDVFFYNTVTGAVSWIDPRPAEHIDDEGRVYYTDPLKPEQEPWWKFDTEHAPLEHSWVLRNVPVGEENAGKPYFHNTKTHDVSWEVPPNLAWKKMHSDRVFYYNTVTGESTRERPEQMGHHDESSGRTYWIDKTTGEATWESEHWWTEVTIGDEDPEYAGRTYWVQELTQEVSVEKPAALAWVEWHEEVPEGEKEL